MKICAIRGAHEFPSATNVIALHDAAVRLATLKMVYVVMKYSTRLVSFRSDSDDGCSSYPGIHKRVAFYVSRSSSPSSMHTNRPKSSVYC